MYKFVSGLKKFVIVVLMLFMFLVTTINCLACQDTVNQDKQTQKEIRELKINTLLKHYNAISEQRKKLEELYFDVRDIGKGKNISDTAETLLILSVVREADLMLETRHKLIALYGIILFEYEPNVAAKELIKNTLDQQRGYEKCLEDIKIILSTANRPVVVLQCDKIKTEIRKTMGLLEEVKKFFE